MRVIPFEEKYRQDFIDFNTDWIVSNFGFLEEHDIETFEKIDEQMEEGAMIFFAVENDTALATCMAVPMEGTTWEICKLGSNKNLQHKGAGSAVFEEAMKWALNHGADRLFILSNSKLKPAIHIYKKHGFKEIQLENYEYIRGDIAFEYKKMGENDLKNIPYVGKGMEKIFFNIGIFTIDDLVGKDAEELYLKDCMVKGFEDDRCVLYVFRMAVYYANNKIHEPEKLKWWNWK